MTEPTRRAAETASAPPTVRLEGVSLRYDGAAPVLRDVNLSLPRGSFHFLTGPSGAGKSSLLRLLTLSTRPDAGRIELFGEDVTSVSRGRRPPIRRRLGLVFQDFRLLDHLSAFDNVALPLRLAGRKPADYAADVLEMLAWVGLDHVADASPRQLSGGEKQRLAIARAVINRPDLILADEPTGSVDAAMATRLLKLFQSLNRLGATVLIASHDEALAKRSGAQRLRLVDGRLEAGT
ncbi:MAG TPA: ATP-binding cassette domain-containing protein [Brevundimonas sp.]|jgi:cell division transport system ATP-binding protein|uniref:cell division ATP-binding protein FtsE n=1 Tax=Brevundimonas sp. TaxID=1871086 RepID=UPI002E0EA928|nr:ATP-binding cassette domain-containing protein [Brevundimonas sp.]